MYILKDIFVTLKYQASIFAKCFIQKWRAQRSNVVWVNCRRINVTPPSASLPLLALKSFFFPVAVCDSQFVIFSVA